MNFRMKEMVENGEAIDLSPYELGAVIIHGAGELRSDVYAVPNFVEGIDYCILKEEKWIWSIGRHKSSGIILASTDTIFYQHPDYECMWLR